MNHHKRFLIMKILSLLTFFIIGLFTANTSVFCQSPEKTIHVFVALCDNQHQGIIPVSPRLGNGEDLTNNLYWGAGYGVKSYFAKSTDWKLISSVKNPKPLVLERCIFKHKTRNVYLAADAYNGIAIKQTIIDFLESAAGNQQEIISVDEASQKTRLSIGGNANLVVFVGHDGLMDFPLDRFPTLNPKNRASRDAIILSCASKPYFGRPLRETGANPLLWTSGLMAPEAYTLKSAIDGWMAGEPGEKIRLRAAQSYHQYQKCGLNAARKLLVTGW